MSNPAGGEVGFTQGDWEAVLPGDPRGQPVPYYRGLICLVQHSSPSEIISVVSDGRMVSPTEWEANAKLIAAAPEMYEALEMIRDADDDCDRDDLPTMPKAARAKIDAALSKARGQLPKEATNHD